MEEFNVRLEQKVIAEQKLSKTLVAIMKVNGGLLHNKRALNTFFSLKQFIINILLRIRGYKNQ